MAEPSGSDGSGTVPDRSSSFISRLIPEHCRQEASEIRLPLRTLLRAHLSAIGTSALRFFTPTANGFRVSFNGSITFHRLGQKQEEHSEEEPKSNEVDHLRRMCNVARLEAEIRELELKHRLKVDELSRMFKDQ